MSDYNAFAQNFVKYYFDNFNYNPELPMEEQPRSELAGLYNDDSIATFQTEELAGMNKIMEYLVGRVVDGEFQPSDVAQVQKGVDHIVAQPVGSDSYVLISVQGWLKATPEEENAVVFTEIFVVMQDVENGTATIMNQIQSLHTV